MAKPALEALAGCRPAPCAGSGLHTDAHRWAAAYLCLSVFICGSVLAATKTKKAAPANPLKARIEALLASPDARRAHWGVKVVALDSGRVLYTHNEHQFFVPASNAKLFTTAAVLDGLGPDFKFHTTVESAVPPDKLGRISGDVVLVGRGDPNLSARVLPYNGRTEHAGDPLKALDILADQVTEIRGVRYVDGDVVADDTYFVYERYGKGWAQDDLLWSYGAPASALTVNDNVVFLEVLPGEKAGDPALVKLDPFEGYYRVENRILTVDRHAQRSASGGGDEELPARRILVNREPGSLNLELWGTIPVDDAAVREMLAIDDPAMFAAQYFLDALQRRGVVVYGHARVRHLRPIDLPAVSQPSPAAPAHTTVLATFESARLVEGLKVAIKDSQNLHAELMLRTLGREKHSNTDIRNTPGSVGAGLEELKAFLTRAKLDPDEYVFFDGSGLSRQNLVTPAAVVQLLAYMHGSPYRDTWLDLLPVAGVDGTLSERLKDSPASGKLRGKTGTLGHVKALSGYATAATGEPLAFSIFVNNHNLRSRQVTALMDRVAAALVAAK